MVGFLEMDRVRVEIETNIEDKLVGAGLNYYEGQN